VRWHLFRYIEDTPHLDWLLLTKRPQNFRQKLPKQWLAEPQHNVWLLTTVEEPQFLWRLDALMDVPAVMHGISVEPMLAPIKLPPAFLGGVQERSR